MTQTDPAGVSSPGSESSAPGSFSSDFFRFLRNGHVLSALLREVFEEDFVSDLKFHSVTRVQFRSLKLIALCADLKVGEVARCVGVSPSACTKNIDRLERLGLVSRVPSLTDRRATLLRINQPGLEMVQQVEAMKADRLAPLIRSLGRPKVGQLCNLLEELCLGIHEIGHGSRGPCLRCAGYYDVDCAIERKDDTCVLRMGSTPLSEGAVTADFGESRRSV